MLMYTIKMLDNIVLSKMKLLEVFVRATFKSIWLRDELRRRRAGFKMAALYTSNPF